MKKFAFIIVFAVLTIIVMILALANVINQALGMCVAIFLMIIFNMIMGLYAKKSDIKIISYLMFFLSFIGFILLIYNIVGYFKINKGDNDYKFQVTLKKSDVSKELLFTHGGHDYYANGVKDIKVTIKSDGKEYELKGALDKGIVTLDEILDLAVPNSNTIGYKIYYDGGQEQYNNDEYSIVVCENDKKDVIFGTFDYVYDESICK